MDAKAMELPSMRPTVSDAPGSTSFKAPASALDAAGAMAALEAVEAGLPAGVVHGEAASLSPTPRTAQQLWAAARAAMKDGRVRALNGNDAYSLVSAVFSALFPEDFDRVSPEWISWYCYAQVWGASSAACHMDGVNCNAHIASGPFHVWPQVVPVFNFREVDLLMRQW